MMHDAYFGYAAIMVLAPLLAVSLPLLAAVAVVLRILGGQDSGDAAEPGTARWAEAAALGALAVLLPSLAAGLALGFPGRFEAGTWLAAGAVRLPFAFFADARSLGFATLIALVGWIVVRFSRTYLHREAGYHRFFAALCLFLAAMQLIALSADAALMFVGWELAGFSSWLLIGYDTPRPAATGNALYAFVMNRLGDAGFLLGLALAFAWVGSADWAAIGGHAFDKVSARLLLFGFVVAAVAKSAQLPLAGWLPRALEGPTPSSAIFYGAIMVHAGVWMLLRLEPVLLQVPDIMVQVALFGGATVLYAWISGLVQTDVKTSLVFATTAQVGLMFLWCGLGWFDLAYAHLLLHAAWRAWQFLLAPQYMHMVRGPAPPPPAWLACRPRIFVAALQRFWLDALVQALAVRPTQAVARDLRSFDDRVLMPLLATPDDAGEPVRRGVAARAMQALADRFAALEDRLTSLAASGRPAQLLRQAGDYFLEVEALLERPRYLVLLVSTTFMVIL